MFIRQMTYLLALAREKHFARAAETCHVTQSTLSAGLKSLERELGMTLVIREPRFMGLTPEGERVAEWAYQILADYESLKQDVGTYREGLKGTLRLGVIPAAMPTVALLTAPFCAKHPGVTVDIQSVSSSRSRAVSKNSSSMRASHISTTSPSPTCARKCFTASVTSS